MHKRPLVLATWISTLKQDKNSFKEKCLLGPRKYKKTKSIDLSCKILWTLLSKDQKRFWKSSETSEEALKGELLGSNFSAEFIKEGFTWSLRHTGSFWVLGFLQGPRRPRIWLSWLGTHCQTCLLPKPSRPRYPKDIQYPSHIGVYLLATLFQEPYIVLLPCKTFGVSTPIRPKFDLENLRSQPWQLFEMKLLVEII